LKTNERRRYTFAVALVAISALATTACSSDSQGGSDADVTVTLRDFTVQASPTSVPSGQLTFAGTNTGGVVHEMEVFSVPDGIDPNTLPVDSGVADVAELGLIDEVEDIAPGTDAELSIDLEPGTYALLCNLPGHYEQGMHTTITVR